MAVPVKSTQTAQNWLEDSNTRKANLARGLLESVATVDKAMARSGVDTTHDTPRDRGVAAFLRSVQIRASDRQNAIARMALRNDSPTMQKLQARVLSSATAFDTLSVIGYQFIRDLHAEGLLYPEIAEDLGLGLNDLLAFMRSHPDASADAKIDAAHCADSRISTILREMGTNAMLNRTQVDALKNRAMIELELAKRLSGAWAMRQDDDGDAGDVAQATQMQLNIINQNGAGPQGIPAPGTVYDEEGNAVVADGTVQETPNGVSISFRPE